jgi:hypothetical protein
LRVSFSSAIDWSYGKGNSRISEITAIQPTSAQTEPILASNHCESLKIIKFNSFKPFQYTGKI